MCWCVCVMMAVIGSNDEDEPKQATLLFLQGHYACRLSIAITLLLLFLSLPPYQPDARGLKAWTFDESENTASVCGAREEVVLVVKSSVSHYCHLDSLPRSADRSGVFRLIEGPKLDHAHPADKGAAG